MECSPLCSWAPTGTSPFMDALTANGTHHPADRQVHGCDGREEEVHRGQAETSLLTAAALPACGRQRVPTEYRDIRGPEAGRLHPHPAVHQVVQEQHPLQPEVATARAVGPPSPSPQAKPPFPWALDPAPPAPGRVQLRAGRGRVPQAASGQKPPSAQVRGWASLKSHVRCVLPPPP